MRRRQVPGPGLRRLAGDQCGLVTTGQAGLDGFGEDALQRMVADGHWRREANGLYDVAPGHTSFDKRVWSAVLQAGAPCAVGGEAALRLHGLDRPADRIIVWVPADRRPRSGDAGRIRRDRIGRVVGAVGTPPRIRAEDAVVDVGQYLRVERLVALLTDAVRLRITTTDRLGATIAGRRRVRGRAGFLDILNDLAGIESTLEYAYRRDVERAHGLPSARHQRSMTVGTRSDAIYDEQALLVELDGRLGHEDATSAFRDLRRDNAHATRGMLTLRYGSADVRGRPCAVARQVWDALAARGWREPLEPCPRCPVEVALRRRRPSA